MEAELSKIVNNYDESTLLRKTQEECGELLVAISHYCLDRKGSIKEMEKELADVMLHVTLIERLMKKHHGTVLTPLVMNKIDRIVKRIDNNTMIKFVK